MEAWRLFGDPWSRLASVTLLLAAALAAAVLVLVAVQAWVRREGKDRGVWENTLVDWRNLRDEGVLSEEEYRKVRTLVEPRTRIGTPDPDVRHRPAAGPSGPDLERT
jgi:hypothetical protein